MCKPSAQYARTLTCKCTHVHTNTHTTQHGMTSPPHADRQSQHPLSSDTSAHTHTQTLRTYNSPTSHTHTPTYKADPTSANTGALSYTQGHTIPRNQHSPTAHYVYSQTCWHQSRDICRAVPFCLFP